MKKSNGADAAVLDVLNQASRGRAVTIKAPSFQTATFKIVGTAPLVIHRFSSKTKNEMKLKMEIGKAAGSKKNREAKSTDALYEESYYQAPEGWHGFNASALRAAMISACRLVGFKMTLAKLSVLVLPDGYDAKEVQTPLIRIHGEPVKLESICRVETGQPYVSVRTMYQQWSANPKIRWDSDQFELADIANLLMRVGAQVGLCEGRPDSKNSAGMGWGLFEIENPKGA